MKQSGAFRAVWNAPFSCSSGESGLFLPRELQYEYLVNLPADVALAGPDLPDAVEHQRPDCSLYPRFSGAAYGCLTRGCPCDCGFCIVSGKEGRRSHQVAGLSEFWDKQREQQPRRAQDMER